MLLIPTLFFTRLQGSRAPLLECPHALACGVMRPRLDVPLPPINLPCHPQTEALLLLLLKLNLHKLGQEGIDNHPGHQGAMQKGSRACAPCHVKQGVTLHRARGHGDSQNLGRRWPQVDRQGLWPASICRSSQRVRKRLRLPASFLEEGLKQKWAQ